MKKEKHKYSIEEVIKINKVASWNYEDYRIKNTELVSIITKEINSIITKEKIFKSVLETQKNEIIEALIKYFHRIQVIPMLEFGGQKLRETNSDFRKFNSFIYKIAESEDILPSSIKFYTKKGAFCEIKSRSFINWIWKAMIESKAIKSYIKETFNKIPVTTNFKQQRTKHNELLINDLYSIIALIPELKTRILYSNMQCKLIASILECIDISITYQAVRIFLKNNYVEGLKVIHQKKTN